MNKAEILKRVDQELKLIQIANGFLTELGLNVQYGISGEGWEGSPGIQWVDGEDNYVKRDQSDLLITVSAVDYGDRSQLLEKGINIECDLKKVFKSCGLAQAKISIMKSVEVAKLAAIQVTALIEMVAIHA